MSNHPVPAFGLQSLVAAIVLLALTSLAGCLHLSVSDVMHRAYTVRDSGLIAVMDDGQAYWMDNDRVLFAARADAGTAKQAEGVSERAGFLTVWNVRTGEKTRLHTAKWIICYSDGYVLTHTGGRHFQIDSTVEYTYGRLGESMQTLKDSRPEWLIFGFDPCHGIPENPRIQLLQGIGTSKIPLHPTTGFFLADVPPLQVRNAPVTYYSDDHSKGVPMPFKSHEYAYRGFYPFKNAHFIIARFAVPDRDLGKLPLDTDTVTVFDPGPRGWMPYYWWLYPDGNLETGSIRPSHSPRTDAILPFRDGVAWFVGSYQLGIEAAGLYVTSGRIERRVLVGFVRAASTSPDGCKIAVNHDPSNYSGLASISSAPWKAQFLSGLGCPPGNFRSCR